ncbi:hypothetical protein PR048_001691 [Dryococelus australis]|uniref:Uncharacterized protein n=1 Tax=Dryococelus australis TaxID=614101 RepID=A0ABQ9IIS2_9NEOP|nr:hypothetical protein PR048_001691 [Dryococelus australis]
MNLPELFINEERLLSQMNGWNREGKKRKRGASREKRKMGHLYNSAMCKNSKVGVYDAFT